MVESAPLLREYRLTPIEGSNPSLSATSFPIAVSRGSVLQKNFFCLDKLGFLFARSHSSGSFSRHLSFMHLRRFRTILSGLILSLLGSTGGHSFAAAIFDRDVAPLLIRHCLECHNGFDLKGKLDLSQRAVSYTHLTLPTIYSV